MFTQSNQLFSIKDIEEIQKGYEAFIAQYKVPEEPDNQFPVTLLLQDLGYPPCTGGVCSGLGAMWMIAELCDDENKYNERLKLVNFLYTNKYVLGNKRLPLKSVLEKIVERKSANKKLLAFEEQLLDLKVFCAELELIHNIDNHYDVAENYVEQGNIEKIAEILGIMILEAHNGIRKIYSQPVIGTKNEIQSYLEKLAKIINKEQKKGVKYVLAVDSHQHRVAMKIKELNEIVSWSLADPNFLPAKDINKNDISMKLFRSFFNKDINAFDIKIFTLGDNPHINTVTNNLNRLKKEIKISGVKTKTLAPSMLVHGVNLAHIAAMSGDIEVFKKIISKKPSLLTVKNNYDQIPAHYAAQYGHGDILIEIVKYKPAMLLERTMADMSSLDVAAKFGRNHIFTMLKDYPQLIGNQNQMGNTPAHLAAVNNQPHVLLAIGQIDEKFLRIESNLGKTPAHVAAINSSACIDIIAQINPDLLNVKNKFGNTPAHDLLNSSISKYSGMLALTRNGADFTIPDDNGKSAIEIAIKKNKINYLAMMLAVTNKPMDLSKDIQFIEIDELIVHTKKYLSSVANPDGALTILEKIKNRQNLLGIVFDEKIKDKDNKNISFLHIINELQSSIIVEHDEEIKKNKKKQTIIVPRLNFLNKVSIIQQNTMKNQEGYDAIILSEKFNQILSGFENKIPAEDLEVLADLNIKITDLTTGNNAEEIINLIKQYYIKYEAVEGVSEVLRSFMEHEDIKHLINGMFNTRNLSSKNR